MHLGQEASVNVQSGQDDEQLVASSSVCALFSCLDSVARCDSVRVSLWSNYRPLLESYEQCEVCGLRVGKLKAES